MGFCSFPEVIPNLKWRARLSQNDFNLGKNDPPIEPKMTLIPNPKWSPI